MSRLGVWPAFGVAALLIGLVLAGAAAGWYGPLETCGADAAQVCVRWPAPAALLCWLLVVGLLAALLVWQAREWRRG